jgi:hypothetical protein
MSVDPDGRASISEPWFIEKASTLGCVKAQPEISPEISRNFGVQPGRFIRVEAHGVVEG